MFQQDHYTKLLNRQLRSAFKSQEPNEELTRFITLVDEAYKHYDSTRSLLERSMDISTIELQHKNEELIKINEMLDDFNHSISHDLKTHVINIISLVKLVKKYTLLNNSEKVIDIVSKLEVSGNQLNKIIYSFLEISKFEHILKPTKEYVAIEPFINAVQEEFSQMTEQKQASLRFNPNGVKSIFTSRAHLSVILRNIISNGIKYAKPGQQPIIDITFFDKPGAYTITIKDNGIGIDLSKNKGKLFSMFSRLENHDNIEGTGIGLFLVKRLVEKNGGSIRMESELHIGTTVILEFEKQH